MLKSCRHAQNILIMAAFIIIISLITGCNSTDSNQDTAANLKNDAMTGLKGAYAEEFTRLTIIRGALYKFVVNPQNPLNLGVAVGAVEASVFPEEYELNRFTKLENLPAEMRREIIDQPMLALTVKKRETLNHIYTAVLKPLAAGVEKNKPANTHDIAVLNNVIKLLDTLAQEYAVLAAKDIDLKGSEAQRAFFSIQYTLKELQKLQLVK